MENSLFPNCSLCRNINVETLSAPDGHLYADNIVQARSAQTDCTFCNTLCLMLEDDYFDTGDEFDSNSASSSPAGPIVFRAAGGRIEISCGERLPMYLEVYTLHDDQSTSIFPVKQNLPENTSSESTFNWARNQIRHCREKHDCASLPGYPAEETGNIRRPTRVIDVFAFGPEKADVKIVEVSSLAEPVEYFTLSHCWGTNMGNDGKTTPSNLKERRERIGFDTLPKTFRDCIQITRQLDCRYLWIDALCIIQGPQGDWLTEQIKMDAIYAGAVANVSADRSQDTNGGCFNSQSISHLESYQHHFTFDRTLSNGKRSCFYVYFEGDSGRAFGELLAPQAITKTKVSTRGWICQERLLSPRILHYTESQLIFECSHGFKVEEELSAMPYWQQAETFPELLRQLKATKDDYGDFQLLYTWNNLIIAQSYSKRELTYSTDKLPAISGIARILHDVCGWGYIGGLWERYLHVGLAWKRAGPLVVPSSYCAPSFSWASKMGPVFWDSWTKTEHAPHSRITLIDYQAQYLHDLPGELDKFGQLKSGYLRLRAQVKKAYVVHDGYRDVVKLAHFQQQRVSTAERLQEVVRKFQEQGTREHDNVQRGGDEIDNHAENSGGNAEGKAEKELNKRESDEPVDINILQTAMNTIIADSEKMEGQESSLIRSVMNYARLKQSGDIDIYELELGIPSTNFSLVKSPTSSERLGGAYLDLIPSIDEEWFEVWCMLLYEDSYYERSGELMVLLIDNKVDGRSRVGVGSVTDLSFFEGCSLEEVMLM